MTSQPALADSERYKELVHPPRPSTTVPVRIRMSDAYAPLLQADGTALRVCGDKNAGLTKQASHDMAAPPVGSSIMTPDWRVGGDEVSINYVIDNGLNASMQSTYLMPVKAEIAPGPEEQYETPCPVAIDPPATPETAGVHVGGGGHQADLSGAPASVGLDQDTDTPPLPPPRFTVHDTPSQAVQIYEYSATIVAHPVTTVRARTLRSASDSAQAASRSRSETQTSEPAKLPADYLTIIDSCSRRDSSRGVADP